MAQKYRGELTDPALVDRILEDSGRGGGGGEYRFRLRPPAPNPEIARLLEGLSKVTQWAEPVKRGRFTYDDREFYESIAKQHASGRILSDRQVAALKKMAAKYSVKSEE